MNEPTSPPHGSSRPRRWVRRLFSVQLLYTVVCLATFIALFYAVENWRGHRAWAKTRQALEARGAVLDWTAYIPKPVPDEQNVMKVPLMSAWFIKGAPGRSDAEAKLNRRSLEEKLVERYGAKPVIAEIIGVPAGAAAPGGVRVSETVQELVPRIGEEWPEDFRSVPGPSGSVLVNRYRFGEPARRFYVRGDLENWGPALEKELGATMKWAAPITLESAGVTNHVRVRAARPKAEEYPAAEFLEWTKQFGPEMEMIREAMRRPYAQIDADYSRPWEIPIPNFVMIRKVAQVQGEAALAHLLLSKPVEAFRDLEIIFNLQGPVTASQPTLVSAMIRVAIVGLSADVIRRGIEWRAWPDEQLAALQEQLSKIQLLPEVKRALAGGERAAVIYMFERYPRKDIARVFGPEHKSVWGSGIGQLIMLTPRGWIDQNLAFSAPIYQEYLEAIDRRPLEGAGLDATMNKLGKAFSGWSPYTFLASMTTPNFNKAFQTAARNQTLVNQAIIVCALERSHRATGRYPDSIDSLIPAFLDRAAPDLMSGGPLKYERTSDGGFKLWSVGWNGKDDGGSTAKEPTLTAPDWVWDGAPKNGSRLVSASN